MLVLLLVLLLSVGAGIVAAVGVGRWPQADPALSATRALDQQRARWRRAHLFLHSRLDPAKTTGLALTFALVAVVVAGVVLGAVVYMVRTKSGVVGIDESVARWSAAHVEGVAFQSLRILTAFGSTPVIVLFAVACVLYGWRQGRIASIALFLTLVVGGQSVISNLIKFGVDRVRPDLGHFGALGSASFPSGHATAASATYAALALVIGRNRPARTRATLAGIAVSIAVGVACSRALLGVHWFSDVVAGLVLGWTWFAVCAVAFGGRLLWFGAPVEAASSSPSGPQTPVGSPR